MINAKVALCLAALAGMTSAQAQSSSSVRTQSELGYGQSEADYLQVVDTAGPVARNFSGDGSDGSQFSGALLADHLTHTLRARVAGGSLSSFSGMAAYTYQFTVPDQLVVPHPVYQVNLRVDGLFSRLNDLGTSRVRANFSVADLDNTEVIFDENFNPSFNTSVMRFELMAGEDRFVDDGQNFDILEGGWTLTTNLGEKRAAAINTGFIDTGVLSILFSARPGATLTVFGSLGINASAAGSPVAFSADMSRTFSADLFDDQGRQIELAGLRNFDGSISAAVPEPQSWALALAGLALLALRRRRH